MKSIYMICARIGHIAIGISAVVILAACGAGAPLIIEDLDPETAVTFTRASGAVVLYRDNSDRAAHARAYVYLGPLQVNRMGQYSRYLWLGIWSTISDPDPTATRDAFESIVLYADGEPLALDASGWTPSSIGLSRQPYPSPAAGAINAYYAITLDQVRLIAEAGKIRLRTGSMEPVSFEPWNNRHDARESLTAFLDYLAYE